MLHFLKIKIYIWKNAQLLSLPWMILINEHLTFPGPVLVWQIEETASAFRVLTEIMCKKVNPELLGPFRFK